VKLLLIGGIIGLIIGVAVTVFYFSLATFFTVQAKVLEASQKWAGSGNAVQRQTERGRQTEGWRQQEGWISSGAHSFTKRF
jgi:hypothetical protein